MTAGLSTCSTCFFGDDHCQGESGKQVFFPGEGEFRKFRGWLRRFGKDLKSQRKKIWELENKWLHHFSENNLFPTWGKD